MSYPVLQYYLRSGDEMVNDNGCVEHKCCAIRRDRQQRGRGMLVNKHLYWVSVSWFVYTQICMNEDHLLLLLLLLHCREQRKDSQSEDIFFTVLFAGFEFVLLSITICRPGMPTVPSFIHLSRVPTETSLLHR